MSSIFIRTISKAINVYRQLLRRYLNQSDRMAKLNDLNLRDPQIFESEVGLFLAGQGIVKDIEDNMKIPEQGYYSYSGIAKFCEYLKEYLNNYEIENGVLIHKAQKASRALLQAIQLISLPEDRLDKTVAQKLFHCNEIIASFGSDEQIETHKSLLEQKIAINENFYTSILNHFENRDIQKFAESA